MTVDQMIVLVFVVMSGAVAVLAVAGNVTTGFFDRRARRNERHHEEKKAAFAAFQVATNELTATSIAEEDQSTVTERAQSAMHAIANAAATVDLISADPALRKAVMASLGLMAGVLSDSGEHAWGEHMEMIRGLMRAELHGC